MPLINILADLAADQGFRIDINSQRERVVALVNDAAKEIYDQNDLENSLLEQVFSFATTDQLIYLPWYVGDPKAVRKYNTKQQVDLVDMRPRYATSGWRDDFANEFRIKKRNSALKRDLVNASKLTIALPDGEVCAETFTVTITGKTAQSARASETIIFNVGDVGSKTSINLYIDDIESIRKNIVTLLDLTITNGAAEVMAELPNHLLQSQYTLLQVTDRNFQYSDTTLIEVLFKQRYLPMQNDYDSFICGDDYDRAIYYKTVALYKAKFSDSDSMTIAAAYDTKAETDMNRFANNKQGPLHKPIDFGPSRLNFSRRTCKLSSITGQNAGCL